MNTLSRFLTEKLQKYKFDKEKKVDTKTLKSKKPRKRTRKRKPVNNISVISEDSNSNSNNNNFTFLNKKNKTTKSTVNPPTVIHKRKNKTKKAPIKVSIKPSMNIKSKQSLPKSVHKPTLKDKLQDLTKLLKDKYHAYLEEDSERHNDFMEKVNNSKNSNDNTKLLNKLDELIERKKDHTIDLKTRKQILDEISDIKIQLQKKKKVLNKDELLKQLYPKINDLKNHDLFTSLKQRIPQYYVPDNKELEDSFTPVIKTESRVSHLLVGIMFESIGYITSQVLPQKPTSIDTHIFLKGGRALQVQGMPHSKSFDLDILIKATNKSKETKKELALELAQSLINICSLHGLYNGTCELSMRHEEDKNLVKIAYLYTHPGMEIAKAEALVDITYHQDESSPTYEYFDTTDRAYNKTQLKGMTHKGKLYKMLYITQKPVQMFLEKMKILEFLCYKTDTKLCSYSDDDLYRIKKTLTTLMTIDKYASQTTRKEISEKVKNRRMLYSYMREFNMI